MSVVACLSGGEEIRMKTEFLVDDLLCFKSGTMTSKRTYVMWVHLSHQRTVSSIYMVRQYNLEGFLSAILLSDVLPDESLHKFLRNSAPVLDIRLSEDSLVCQKPFLLKGPGVLIRRCLIPIGWHVHSLQDKAISSYRISLGSVFLLELLEVVMAAACTFRAEEMPSLISCWMASKVMAGVSDVDVLLGGILST
ncbi:hypothetical protein Tco_0825121 [Tanacetum coccineum]